ncbi:MAG: hypothetical protein AAFV53_02375 [Myxococcota bacterium]
MTSSPLMRWGLVFLHCPIPLDEDKKLMLVRLAAQAYFEDEARLRFHQPLFEGEVRATSDTVALGSIIGQRFEADIHLPEGSATLRFLVTEPQLQMVWNQPIPEA